MTTYTTGAIPSPLDTNDYPISLALATAPAAVVGPKFSISPIPPNLNQGNKPWCVAYTASESRMIEQRIEHREWRNFDEGWAYARCKERDGIPNALGTYVRTALDVAKKLGMRTVGHADEAENKILAYYRVPIDRGSFRETLVRRGAILLAMNWDGAWFDTGSDGNLPRPTGTVGGHAVLGTAYDDNHVNVDRSKGAALCRNHWTRAWGSLGNFWLPYGWMEKYAFEMWWTKDKED